jgi:hypothetical protein
MFRLRIDPCDRWFGCLHLWPSHENFAQPLIVVEKVCSIAEPIPLQERCVITFHMLLYVEHRGAEIAVRQLQSLDTDEQNITALRQQLA